MADVRTPSKRSRGRENSSPLTSPRGKVPRRIADRSERLELRQRRHHLDELTSEVHHLRGEVQQLLEQNQRLEKNQAPIADIVDLATGGDHGEEDTDDDDDDDDTDEEDRGKKSKAKDTEQEEKDKEDDTPTGTGKDIGGGARSSNTSKGPTVAAVPNAAVPKKPSTIKTEGHNTTLAIDAVACMASARTEGDRHVPYWDDCAKGLSIARDDRRRIAVYSGQGPGLAYGGDAWGWNQPFAVTSVFPRDGTVAFSLSWSVHSGHFPVTFLLYRSGPVGGGGGGTGCELYASCEKDGSVDFHFDLSSCEARIRHGSKVVTRDITRMVSPGTACEQYAAAVPTGGMRLLAQLCGKKWATLCEFHQVASIFATPNVGGGAFAVFDVSEASSSSSSSS